MTRARQIALDIPGSRDRSVGRMVTSVIAGKNGDLLAALAPLYLSGSVLDTTYGRGNWWTKHRPEGLVAHDLHKLDGVDFRALPHADASFDTVCFDPPYVPRQGSHDSTRLEDQAFRERFGLEESRGQAELLELIAAGLAECIRVARRWVLVKCCDYTNGRTLHLGHVSVIGEAARHGARVHDLIVHASGTGPGGSRIIDPKRVRRAHSYMVVLDTRPAHRARSRAG